MSHQTVVLHARLAVVAAIATCALFFIPSANAAWLDDHYTPSTPGLQYGGPSIAILPDQSFAFLFNRIPGGGVNTIYHQTISPTGTPTTPVAVDEPNGAAENKLYAAPDGSQNITYRPGNGSDGFSYLHVSPANVFGANAHTGVYPQGKVSVADSNGTITAAWSGASNGIDYMRISADGVGTAVSSLVSGAATQPSPAVAADQKGNTYVVWGELVADTKALSVRMIKIDAAGAASSPTTLATVGADYTMVTPPTVAASPDGDLLIGVRPSIFVPGPGPGPMGTSEFYPWSVRVLAGASTGVAAALPGFPDVKFPELTPTVGNGGRGTMFSMNFSAALVRRVLVAHPIAADGTAGTEFPISDDLGFGQFFVATADAAGTATVAWTDDGTTDTALAARLPLGSTTVTPKSLFPGHKSRDLQLATTPYGDVAITAILDNYGPAAPSAGLQYWSNPPACEGASAATAFDTPVNIPLECTSRSAPSGFDLKTAPLNGTASVTAGGTATYTPNAGFSGIDTFTYTAENANGDSPGNTVTVKVAAPAIVPAAPVVPVPVKKSAKFPKGKIKANKKIKVTLTGVDAGKKITIAWKLKKKTAKGGAISTAKNYVTFKSPKKKAKYKVTIKLGSEVLFRGTVKVS
ncbi:MAG: Ig-like domain-containing protein [Solirubrobacterales bacterium]